MSSEFENNNEPELDSNGGVPYAPMTIIQDVAVSTENNVVQPSHLSENLEDQLAALDKALANWDVEHETAQAAK